MPFVPDATELSPNQTRILAAYDNLLDPEAIPQKSLIVWNLLTGEKKEIGRVAANEYLSEWHGPNVLGGASNFNLRWTDLNCVEVYVYQDEIEANRNLPEYNPDRKRFKEIRSFCF